MAISFVWSAIATGSNSSFDIDLTGISMQLGDVVFVINWIAGNTDVDAWVSTPWYTEIVELYANDTRDCNLSVSWKQMLGSLDTSITCNYSTQSYYGAAGIAYVLREVNGTDPNDVSPTTATGLNTAVYNSPSITPVTSWTWVLSIGAGAWYGQETSLTPPSWYTNDVLASIYPGSTSMTISVASKARTSGAEDPAAWSGFSYAASPSNSRCAATIAVKNWIFSANNGFLAFM